MNQREIEEKLERVREQMEARISAGRDPGTARWQAALESLIVTVQEHLLPGKIVAVEALAPDEIRRFKELRVTLDLSPFVNAAFVPARLAEQLDPSQVAHLIDRSSEETPSNKVLVTRVDDHSRIVTAEISMAKPGIDIFEDGSLLGSYNYSAPEECISDLSKIIWIHLKNKGSWGEADYMKYTEDWFYRSARNRVPDLPINVNFSYIHHPVLIRQKTVPAIFRLMKATLTRMFKDPDKTVARANAAILYMPRTVGISRSGLSEGNEAEKESLRIYLEDRLLGLLRLLRGYDIINFKGFSDAEQREFKVMFSQTAEEIFQMIMTKV